MSFIIPVKYEVPMNINLYQQVGAETKEIIRLISKQKVSSLSNKR
jgi:hypothetical protein